MMCFFTVSMYIELGAEFCKKTDLSSISTVMVYVFTICLGVFLTKNTGRIASAVISGNPSLGMGDIAREIRGGLHSLNHAKQTLDRGFEKVEKNAQGIGKRAAEINANREAAKFAAGDAAKNAKHEIAQKAISGELATNMNSSDPAERAAARKEVAGMMKQAGKAAYKDTMKTSRNEFAKDKLFGALTGGMTRVGDAFNGGASGGRLQIGQEFFDGKTWKKADFNDVQKRNKELADLAGKNTVEKYLKTKAEEGKSNQRRLDKDWPEPGL